MQLLNQKWKLSYIYELCMEMPISVYMKGNQEVQRVLFGKNDAPWDHQVAQNFAEWEALLWFS